MRISFKCSNYVTFCEATEGMILSIALMKNISFIYRGFAIHLTKQLHNVTNTLYWRILNSVIDFH